MGLRSTPVDELEVSVRTSGALDALGVTTVGQLLDLDPEAFLGAARLKLCLKEVRELLTELGAPQSARIMRPLE